jgi:hypothetical protein
VPGTPGSRRTGETTPELSDLEMCVVNTSQQTVTATFDLVMI